MKPDAATTAEERELEPWRVALKVRDSLHIKSESAGGWVKGCVKIAIEKRLKIQYVADGQLCEKALLRSSPKLRPLPEEDSPWQTPRGLVKGISAGYLTPGGTGSEKTGGFGGASPVEWLRVSDIEVGEKIGSGGFGSVHRGQLRGREVAVKRAHVLDGSNISQDQLADFQKEVAALQALRHPRLIEFIGVAVDPPLLMIVTELATGGSLHNYLHVQRLELRPDQRQKIIVQVAEGVAFLHDRQPPFVHRDLKSDNVVLDQELNAKLCDFGLTECMERTHISRREAETGSPRYMAPEMFDASCYKLTEKLDIWALGCLIAEVMSGKYPHAECKSIQAIAAKLIVETAPPFDITWAAGVNAQLVQLVTQCFRFDPADRPTAAGIQTATVSLRSLTAD
eukprot:TRINITY_DN36636_c0_g1_i1.p1 TRINITY_DN36636_c0_g1~~TRINITY_DN36636_c0_g1_i1.p1  ORF type:complete len:396 (+),score=73.22 TRINITY_DN36636_c0_g1_i1:129-1316(+)